MKPFLTLVPAIALAFASGLQAQIVTKKSLTLEAARKIAAAAEAEAKKREKPVVIAVVDDGGSLLLLERLDDTQVASVNVAIGKARTAAVFRRPTKVFEEIIGKGRTAMVALEGFTPLQGGVPVLFEGKCIGAIGVSGDTPQQDEEIAYVGAAAAETFSAREATAARAPVAHFGRDAVEAAFAKGAVLFEGKEYMVHASRRDAPGVPEVHLDDADIIHVREGSATFVTGGKLVEGRTVAPGEVRGKDIEGGEARKIAKGDVIIVPAGTPHWFKEVEGPIVYYVVKAR